MRAPLKTQLEIRERLIALIGSNTGVDPHSIETDSSIWEHFPTTSNRGDHPALTSFVRDVQSEFNVFLTEEEWEDPTPDSLAECVRAKLENPVASFDDWAEDREQTLNGMKFFFVVGNFLFGGIILVAGSGPSINRGFVVLAFLVLLNVLLVSAYRAKARRLDAAAPKNPQL